MFLAMLMAGCGSSDRDGDGFRTPADCDDGDSAIHPGAVDVPYDGRDDDCSGSDTSDVDGDGVGAELDCDDDDRKVHPGADDVPYDGIDQDCVGGDRVDVDGDGHAGEIPGGDCDDLDPAIYPGAPEVWYDDVDQDCADDCDYDPDRDGAVAIEWQSPLPSGCGDSPVDCEEFDPTANTQRVQAVLPPDGAVDVDAFAPIQVRVRENEPGVTVRLLLPTGAVVATEHVTTNRETLLWRLGPVSGQTGYPLDAFTTYTVEIEHSCGFEHTTFTTGVGLAPVDPADLLGRSWVIEPIGLTTVGFSVLGWFSWYRMALVEVVGTDGGTVDLRIAAPDPSGAQDLCVPTAEVAGVDFAANPLLAVDSVDLPLMFDGYGTPVLVVHQQGAFEATIVEGDLIFASTDGLVDAEALSPAVGLDADTICVQAGGCVPCPTGAVTCFEESFTLQGTMSPAGPTLVARTVEEIAADPACGAADPG